MLGLCFLYLSAPTEFYPLSLHDALPISRVGETRHQVGVRDAGRLAESHALEVGRDGLVEPRRDAGRTETEDRKSTRLNSSHPSISYAGFGLKKKKHLSYPLTTTYVRVIV